MDTNFISNLSEDEKREIYKKLGEIIYEKNLEIFDKDLYKIVRPCPNSKCRKPINMRDFVCKYCGEHLVDNDYAVLRECILILSDFIITRSEIHKDIAPEAFVGSQLIALKLRFLIEAFEANVVPRRTSAAFAAEGIIANADFMTQEAIRRKFGSEI